MFGAGFNCKEVIYMSEDDKKENSKPVYRFDSEDWVIPASRDEIKKHQSKAFSKKHKKDDKKD